MRRLCCERHAGKDGQRNLRRYVSFASYAFNKSHAACYAYVAFQTAYFKCHYPHEFMAALLTSVLDNTSKVIEYSTECQRLGIKVLQPDINVSRGGFTADGEHLLWTERGQKRGPRPDRGRH